MNTGPGPVTRTSFGTVRCPTCASSDDKVVDSRAADDGSSIRRRRQCLGCGRRFTTYERVEEAALVVVKRSGDRVSFDRAKVVGGVEAAAKNRPVTRARIEVLAEEVEDQARLAGGDVSTEQIGMAVLERLRQLDQVAYMRFASVYRGFSGPADFERELTLLAKLTDPKPAQPPTEPSTEPSSDAGSVRTGDGPRAGGRPGRRNGDIGDQADDQAGDQAGGRGAGVSRVSGRT